MRNKTLMISISILASIVLIVILSSTIFCVRSVDVNFMSNTINLTSKDEIIESGKFKYNQSIFFTNKRRYTKNLEENNPYIKIVNIETVFPNKLIINAVERNELFCIKSYEESSFKNYLIIDNELKILKNEQTFSNTHNNAIMLYIEDEFTQTSLAGKTLNSKYNSLIKDLSVELYAYNNNPLLLQANFESIFLNFENTNNIKIKMRSGAEILIKNANYKLTEKFMLALSTYNNLDNKTSGGIVVSVDNEDKVFGYFYNL